MPTSYGGFIYPLAGWLAGWLSHKPSINMQIVTWIFQLWLATLGLGADLKLTPEVFKVKPNVCMSLGARELGRETERWGEKERDGERWGERGRECWVSVCKGYWKPRPCLLNIECYLCVNEPAWSASALCRTTSDEWANPQINTSTHSHKHTYTPQSLAIQSLRKSEGSFTSLSPSLHLSYLSLVATNGCLAWPYDRVT